MTSNIITHIKEVESLKDSGLSEEVAIQLFQVLTKRFEIIAGGVELSDFQRSLLDLRKHERRSFRDTIDGTCAEFPSPINTLSWRQVKYEPVRITRCVVCSAYFYDASRNGRKGTCYNGYCSDEYEVRRGRDGTIIDPVYHRKVNEEYIDFSPAADDKKGHALLNEAEMTAWRNFIN